MNSVCGGRGGDPLTAIRRSGDGAMFPTMRASEGGGEGIAALFNLFLTMCLSRLGLWRRHRLLAGDPKGAAELRCRAQAIDLDLGQQLVEDLAETIRLALPRNHAAAGSDPRDSTVPSTPGPPPQSQPGPGPGPVPLNGPAQPAGGSVWIESSDSDVAAK